MNQVFFILCALACITNAANYTLTAPKKFRPGSEYKFAVAIYGEESVNYQLEAAIVNQPEDALVRETFNIQAPGINNVFTLQIPGFVPSASYEFHVRAWGDINFNGTHVLSLNKKTHSLFIQTDKYLYKPGQKVLFRVLGIQSDLKPYTDSINVTIYDQSGNKIYQLLNSKNESGVINGHLKLSDITPLGHWKIEANSQLLKKEVPFEVAEYVLPKYEVKVIAPSYYFVNRENPSAQKPLHLTITATYTFGNPVKGYALVEVKLLSRWRRFDVMDQNETVISKNVALREGKADIIISHSELFQSAEMFPFFMHQIISVNARVVESATGVILQGSASIPTEPNRYNLKFLSISSNNFKPGFPYRAYMQLSQVDGSEPLLSDLKFPNGTFRSLEVQLTSDYWNDDFYFQPPPPPPRPPSTIDSPPLPPSPPGPSPSSYESTHIVPISESGFGVLEVPISHDRNIRMTVSFYDEEAHNTVSATKTLEAFSTRDNKHIQISLINANEPIKPDSTLELNIRTSEPISTFQCQILGKGGILHSNSYSYESSSDNITFTISIDGELALNLAPEAKIVVTSVTSTNELVADSLSISVTDYLANKVTLYFDPASVSPGEEVVLNVKSSEDSYVSLLAVDQSVLLLSAGNDVTQKMLFTDLQEYTNEGGYRGNDDFMMWRFCWPIWPGGSSSQVLLDNVGVFVLTNYHISQERRRYLYPVYYAAPGLPEMPGPRPEVRMAYVPPPAPASPPKSPSASPPRKNFPETWIWSDIKAGEGGMLELKYKVPDTITSWIATAFATNSRFGLGISDNPAKVTVLKPFFISLNLPYSIVRGEEFALQATIFNYYGQDLTVDITLPRSNYFQVKECIDSMEGEPKNQDIYKHVHVGNNDAVTVYFWIIPTALGQIPIEVKAFAGVAADSLIHNLLVKPEGQQQSYSSSALIRIPSDDLSVINFNVTLPDADVLVPDSVTVEATLIGDVLGTTINNLDKLLQMPYGCGEQNMVTLAPDVYILKYLTLTNQLTDEIKSKALEFINSGYQRQLTYQRTEGSFSAFGENDAAGSVWLSAFVIKVFKEAEDVIPFDHTRITSTLTWILQHQKEDGSFSEPPDGKVLHTAMQGGATSGISLTAYVLIALLANKDNEMAGFQNKIDLTVSRLERQYESYSQDPYILSIIAYAFHLANSPKLDDILFRLKLLMTLENGMAYWHKEVAGDETQTNGWRSSYLKPQSNDIEMTSYILLICASRRDLPTSVPIAKWLISQRNAEGGFMSTQDTVLGLEALALFGQMVVPPVNSQGLTVQISQDANNEVFNFQTVNRENALLLQSYEIPSSAKNVQFSASGEGLALVQLNVKFHINSQTENRLVRQNLHTNATEDKLDLKICVSWLGTEESGMVLTEVNLLTGYTLSDDYADILKDMIGTAFKRQEFNNNRLSIYLDELLSEETCFIVKLKLVYYLKNERPALVKTYRYYAPGAVVTGYYSPTSTSATADICSAVFNELSSNNNTT